MAMFGFVNSASSAPPGPVAAPSRPPGVLPRNINYIVMGAILLVIIMASFFSGKKGQPVSEGKALSGTSQSQIKNFRDMLEKQRKEVEDARKQLEEKRLREEQAPPIQSARELPSASTSDGIEERRRAIAPFASNIALRVMERDDKVALDRSAQVVLNVESVAGDEKESDSPGQSPKESGRRLPDREGNLFRLYEGTTIQTGLSNRLDGSFTGPVICVVTKDVYSKSGSVLLVPKGSRFIGKASRVEAQNQSRLAVTFKRLLMPNGYSIDLEAAPGLDRTGETGLKDKVNNHRLRTFGISGAIGLLGGLALYRSPGNAYAAAVANASGNSATSSLSQYLNAVPTLTIREGHEVVVYLPNDLLLPEYRP